MRVYVNSSNLTDQQKTDIMYIYEVEFIHVSEVSDVKQFNALIT